MVASMPAAMLLSTGLAEDACTRTSTSPEPGVGAATSSRTAGGVPASLSVTAFMSGSPRGSGREGQEFIDRIRSYRDINDRQCYILAMTAEPPSPPAGVIEERRSSPGLLLALLGQDA